MYHGDNIGFLYNLQPHGWSTCLLYINGDIYTFAITHIFSCPIADIMQAIMLINKGAVESEFIFPGEPGGYRWWLRSNDKQHHKVIITFFESIINIRPSANNRYMEIQSPQIRERVTEISVRLLGGI